MGGKYGEIPAAVIHGEVPSYRSVHLAYVSHFYQKLMEKINRSFWARSQEGKTDELGNIWKPLNPRTHRYKPQTPMEAGVFRLNGRRDLGLLTPGQRRTWQAAYNRKFKELSKTIGSSKARSKADTYAWSLMPQEGKIKRNRRGQRVTPINIRTGRLVASTRPGKVVNHRYYPPKDQTIQFSHRRLRLKLEVPYAKDVDKVRPIIPRDISKWRDEAHKYAMRFALAQYRKLINARNLRNRRRRKTKKR